MSGRLARDGTPRITLFTPTYNSARFLARVWESVQAQTSRDFEWLIVDDGSQDGTPAWVEKRAGDCVVPLRLVAKPQNEGLSSSFRIAVAEARAPYLLPIGHDDSFVPEAMATFVRHLDALPPPPSGPTSAGAPRSPSYAGIAARCMHPDGTPIDAPIGRPYLDASPADAYFLHGRRREKWKCTRTDLVRANLPPAAIDRFVPEGLMWRSIGRDHVYRYIEDALRHYHRDNPNSIMNSPTVRWPRGRAYAQAARLNMEWDYRPLDPQHFRSSMVSYARYCLDAGLTPLQAVRHLRVPAARRLFWACLPAAALAAANDRRKGRLDPGRVMGDWSDVPGARA